jgi:phage/plasmid-associated DNA primase
MFDRAIVVPFNRTFTPEEDDKQLPEKLAKETSGILNLMLDGAHDHLQNGLVVPEKVRTCVAAQRQETDPYASFAADCLLPSPDTHCHLKDVCKAYVEWNKQNPRLRRLTKPEISERLKSNMPSAHQVTWRCSMVLTSWFLKKNTAAASGLGWTPPCLVLGGDPIFALAMYYVALSLFG